MEVSSLPLDARLLNLLRARGVERLFPPQVEAVKAGILDGRNVLMCTTTASGKSLLAEIAAVKAALEGKMALYAVPLKALAYEKQTHFEHYGKLVNVGVSTGEFESDERRLNQYDVVIVTYEKLDSILRHRPSWLNGVGVLVVDEIHYIGDSKRGAVLESVISKIRQLKLETQIIGLSATVGNAREIAEWLKAELVLSTWRPVPLREGVYQGGVIRYANGALKRIQAESDGRVALALDTVAEGGQALVFVASRASTVQLAKSIAKAIANYPEALIDVDRANWLAGEVARASSSKILGRELAELVARGVAFHNAGLEREVRRLVEEGFRSGVLKVVVSTTTLAAGVNLPARRVVVADYKRYDPLLGRGDIPVLEYKQMAGRAGRPGLDPYGEAVLVASSEREAKYLVAKYINGEVEPVKSHMFAPPNLRAHALGAVGGNYAGSIDELVEFFSDTLGYFQSRFRLLRSRLVEVVGELAEWGFLERDGDNLYITELGRHVSRLYLDPETAAEYIRLLKSLAKPNTSAYLYLVLTAEDFPRVRRGKISRRVGEELRKAWGGGGCDQRGGEVGVGNCELWREDFEELARTVTMLTLWIEEADEDEIYEEFEVPPGDLRMYIDLFQWLGNAAAQLAGVLKLREHSRELAVVTARVVHGVREELLELVTSLRGVGRVRARVLYNAGYKTLRDIANASVRELAQLPSIGEKLAASIIEQARAA